MNPTTKKINAISAEKNYLIYWFVNKLLSNAAVFEVSMCENL